tara:strand:- start:23 stop:496 length:474 start_codon:yes stop_codon:yes gene_type:complete
MQRITISIDDGLAGEMDAMARARGYGSRSEALRDMLRAQTERWRQEDSSAAFSVGNLSYVYDRRVRALPERLSELEHAHHDLVVSSTAMRLDHQDSLVSVMLKGRTEALRKLVDHIITQRGVRLAQLNLIAVQPGDDHEHPGDHEHHGHEHLSPVTS